MNYALAIDYPRAKSENSVCGRVGGDGILCFNCTKFCITTWVENLMYRSDQRVGAVTLPLRDC